MLLLLPSPLLIPLETEPMVLIVTALLLMVDTLLLIACTMDRQDTEMSQTDRHHTAVSLLPRIDNKPPSGGDGRSPFFLFRGIQKN